MTAITRPKTILLLHGPNLNLVHQRDPAHYPNLTLQAIEAATQATAQQAGWSVIAHQSNHEGVLIDLLQQESPACAGIIINAGALTHYSYALYDALVDTKRPIIEVHLSKISEREPWRRHSVIRPACLYTIEGKQMAGYEEAVHQLIEHLHHAH